MRRRLLAITLATTTLVVIAFVLPLAGLVRSVARDRAVSGAEPRLLQTVRGVGVRLTEPES